MKPFQTANVLRKIAFAIDKSKNPDKKLVIRDLRKILAAIGKSQAEWEAEFYPEAKTMGDEWYGNADGHPSMAFWGAFEELGWVDWTPASDPKVVEDKMRQLYQQGKLGHPSIKKFPLEQDIEFMYKNFESYKKLEPSYIDGTI